MNVKNNRKFVSVVLGLLIVSLLIVSYPARSYCLSVPTYPTRIGNHLLSIRVDGEGRATARIDGVRLNGGYANTPYGTLYTFHTTTPEYLYWLELLVGAHGVAYRLEKFRFKDGGYVVDEVVRKNTRLLRKAERSIDFPQEETDSAKRAVTDMAKDDDYYMLKNQEPVLSYSMRLDNIGPIKSGSELAPAAQAVVEYDIHGFGDYWQDVDISGGIRVQPMEKGYISEYQSYPVGAGIFVRRDRVMDVLYGLKNFPYELVKSISIRRTVVKGIDLTWRVRNPNTGEYILGVFPDTQYYFSNYRVFNPPLAGFSTAKLVITALVSTGLGMLPNPPYGAIVGFVSSLILGVVYPSTIRSSSWSVDGPQTKVSLTTGGLFSAPMKLADISSYDAYSWRLPNYVPSGLPFSPIYAGVMHPTLTDRALVEIEGSVLIKVWADVRWNDGAVTTMTVDIPIPVRLKFNTIVIGD